MRNKPLGCDVVGDELVITIGIGTLAWAAKVANGGPFESGFKITNQRGFACDVAHELEREDEVGNTLLNALMDAAMEKARDNGSPSIAYPSNKKGATE